MATTRDLLKFLQNQLRKQKKTYADIARELGLSESSIKRSFSKGDMTLSRLQQICEVIGLDLADLATEAVEARRNLTKLTEEQEQTIIEEPKFLLFAYLVTMGWTVEEILDKYLFEPAEATRMLVKLDKMKLIELLPENRLRLRIARDFNWRENGPISRYFEQQVQREFFKADFTKGRSLKLAVNGYISQTSMSALHKRMESLHREFSDLTLRDGQLRKDKLLPVTMVTAVRPWVFSTFHQFARDPEDVSKSLE
ncbi:MAG: helix-turn-helix transcriptional regulator [Pseudomonadota bacterium]